MLVVNKMLLTISNASANVGTWLSWLHLISKIHIPVRSPTPILPCFSRSVVRRGTILRVQPACISICMYLLMILYYY
jgi:hypothetical protein